MYEYPDLASPLRQGDIFVDLPWLLFDPSSAYLGKTKVDLAETGFVQSTPVGVLAEPSPGIILSAAVMPLGSLSLSLVESAQSQNEHLRFMIRTK